jgi:acyl-CoA synthetase (AMP-forming)/AMP-acid ligase II
MTSANAQMAGSATNFAALFVDRVKATPDKEAFRYLDHGEWVSVTWQETATRVESLAAGLLALGIETELRREIAYRGSHLPAMADGRPPKILR